MEKWQIQDRGREDTRGMVLSVRCHSHIEGGDIRIEGHHAGSSPAIMKSSAFLILCLASTGQTVTRWIFSVIFWRPWICIERIHGATDVVWDNFATWIGITLLARRKVETYREVDRNCVCHHT